MTDNKASFNTCHVKGMWSCDKVVHGEREREREKKIPLQQLKIWTEQYDKWYLNAIGRKKILELEKRENKNLGVA